MTEPLPVGTAVKVREEALEEGFPTKHGEYNTNEVGEQGWFYVIEEIQGPVDRNLQDYGADWFYKCKSIATGVNGLGWYSTEVVSWEQANAGTQEGKEQ